MLRIAGGAIWTAPIVFHGKAPSQSSCFVVDLVDPLCLQSPNYSSDSLKIQWPPLTQNKLGIQIKLS